MIIECIQTNLQESYVTGIKVQTAMGKGEINIFNSMWTNVNIEKNETHVIVTE